MDFGLLPKSALELITALSIAFNISSTPASDTNLTSPDLLSSYNLQTQNLQSLNIIQENTGIELVIKEPEEPVVVTVEQPVVYTVIQPSPKPSPEVKGEDKIEGKIEIMKDAKAEDSSPSPTATPTPTPTPAPASAVPMGTDSYTLFQMVNDHRAKLGLASFEKDGRLCEIARNRAPQVNSELASGTLHKGFKALNLPYWATENIAAYSTIEENLHFWLSDYIHKKAIEGDSKYSCVACSGASCSQIFTSFVSK